MTDKHMHHNIIYTNNWNTATMHINNNNNT